MKKLFLFCLTSILLTNFNLNAQVNQKDLFNSKIIKFNKLRNSGVGLTIGGVVLTTVGIVVLSKSEIFDMNSPNYGEADGNYFLGSLGISLGAASIAGGITMWVIGANKTDYYNKKLNQLSLDFNSNPKQIISLTYHF